MDEQCELASSDSSPSTIPISAHILSRHRLFELDEPLAGQITHLAFVREIILRARTVEHGDPPVRHVERLPEHRAERRDPGSAGDEEKVFSVRLGGEGELAEWAFDVNERTGIERQMRARRPFVIQSDEQFQIPVPLSVGRSRGQRIRLALLTPVCRDEDGLAGKVGEGFSLQIDPKDPRSRSGREYFADRQREKHGAFMLSHSNGGFVLALITMPMTRRARGAVLRLVRRRRAATGIGLVLVAPAAWVEFSGGDFAWWMQGLALIGGAIGIALLWTGLAGLGPDWIDENRS